MKKIILDTNFLMIPGMFKVDIFSEIKRIANFTYELYIIDKTITELENIIKSKQSKSYDKVSAKIGLALIKAKKIKKIKSTEKYVDDDIVKNSDRNTVVATSDKELKFRLKNKGVKLIILKKKQFLEIE